VDAGWALNTYGTAMDVATDEEGNSYVTGWTELNEHYVEKYSYDGELLWSNRYLNPNAHVNGGWRIAIDPLRDAVYVAGQVDYRLESVDFDPSSTHPGDVDIFITDNGSYYLLKLDTDGVFQWVAHGVDDVRELAIDRSGYVYCVGGWDVGLLRKVSAGGAVIWENQFRCMTAEGMSQARGIAIDDKDLDPANWSAYVTGVFKGECEFGATPEGNPVTATGDSDFYNAYMLRIQADGGHAQWVQHIGDPGGSSYGTMGNSVALSGSGDVYSAGSFSDTVDFDPDPSTEHYLTGAGGRDAFLWRLSPDGNLKSAQSFGGPYDDFAYAVAVDETGNTCLNGWFNDTADFDPSDGTFELTSAGGSDVFVVKLNPQGNLVFAERAPGGSVDYFPQARIAVDSDGNIYVSGNFRDGSRPAEFPTGETLNPGGFLFRLEQLPIVVMQPSAPLTTSEAAGTATFEVVLAQPPTDTVTIALSSTDPSEGVLVGATGNVLELTFDASNYDQAQTVTVIGRDDSNPDPDSRYAIDFAPAVSTDPTYNGVESSHVHLVNADDESALVTFSSGEVSLEIPDAGGNTPGELTSTLLVPEDGTILDVDVYVDIFHLQAEQLDVYLTSPSGTQVELFTDIGGTERIGPITLDDEAPSSIADYAQPGARYRPEQPLSALDGEDVHGTWTLEVYDDQKKPWSRGTLNEWSITAWYTLPAPRLAIDDVSVTEGN
jgi:subtilisin-like proprotein convertase family protein